MRELLIEKLDIHPEDIESRSMGIGRRFNHGSDSEKNFNVSRM